MCNQGAEVATRLMWAAGLSCYIIPHMSSLPVLVCGGGGRDLEYSKQRVLFSFLLVGRH